MGIFNKFKKVKSEVTIEELISEKYEKKYYDQCKYIWKNYVPESGQSNILQGELLREIEKLRYEAQDNGNINWDKDFSWFCDFIIETLCYRDIFSDDEKAKIILALEYIKECGNYAKQWNDGQISDDDVDMNRIAYTKDNLYDMVSDAIGYFQLKTAGPIPFNKNDEIKR